MAEAHALIGSVDTPKSPPSIIPSLISREIEKQLAGKVGPRGRDGKSLTVNDIRPLIISEVSKLKPKDGKDGKDGRDGENGKNVERIIRSLEEDASKIQYNPDIAGSVIRPVNEKLAEIFSLDDFTSDALHDAAAVIRFTVNIPSDYDTIQEAVDHLSSRVVGQRVTITLNIESGHTLMPNSTGNVLLVQNGDYGRFRIESEDATVPIDSTVTGDVLKAVNARMPVLACSIDADGNGADGYSLNHGSTGYIPQSQGYGVINAGARGLYVNEACVVSARGCNFSGSIGTGIWVTRGSVANAEGGNFSNCGDGEDDNLGRRGGDIRHGSVANVDSANFSSANQEGLVVSRAFVEANAVNCANAGTYGIDVRFGGICICPDAPTITGAGTLGARVSEGAKLYSAIDQADASVPLNTYTRDGCIISSGAGAQYVNQMNRARTGESITLADDAATSVDLFAGGSVQWGTMTIVCSSTGNGFPNGLVRYRITTSPALTDLGLLTTTNVVLTTGALAGTTGIDGDFTISAHTDGKIYFENRTGSSKSFRVFFTG